MSYYDFLEANTALRLRIHALRCRFTLRQGLDPNTVRQLAAITPWIGVFNHRRRHAGTARHEQQAISARDGAKQLHCHEGGHKVIAKQVPEVAAQRVTLSRYDRNHSVSRALWIRIFEQQMDVGVLGEGCVGGDGAMYHLEDGAELNNWQKSLEWLATKLRARCVMYALRASIRENRRIDRPGRIFPTHANEPSL